MAKFLDVIIEDRWIATFNELYSQYCVSITTEFSERYSAPILYQAGRIVLRQFVHRALGERGQDYAKCLR